jgi:hypothetical protein
MRLASAFICYRYDYTVANIIKIQIQYYTDPETVSLFVYIIGCSLPEVTYRTLIIYIGYTHTHTHTHTHTYIHTLNSRTSYLQCDSF